VLMVVPAAWGDPCPMKIGWVYDARFLRHDLGGVHVERPERLQVILQALREASLLDQLVPLSFPAATPEQLALVHDPAYVEIVRLMCEGGFTFIGSPDTYICAESYNVAALAAGGVLTACDQVAAGNVSRAFCAVRPPGHHAEADQALGFCLINHVALAAEHLVRQHRFARVAIVDIDAHHGNGTQHIFERRRDVLYISLHERPESLPFPGTGYAEETGLGDGAGYTLNVPLDRGCGPRDYLRAVDQWVVPALHDYGPQVLLVSAGFDALASDNVANLSLDPESFGPLTDRLVAVARRYSEGRLVSVLEGGYDLARLGSAVVAHVRAMCS
jgi:acetoin utilization deacetylase AcuC-like enzyme